MRFSRIPYIYVWVCQLTMKMLRCGKKSFSFHEMDEMADLIQVNPSLNYKYIVKDFKIIDNENDK
jgi:hypothetical protein